MDKGPSPERVIELAMDIGALSVRGNHDDAVVKERVQLSRAWEMLLAQEGNGSSDSTSDSNSTTTRGATGTTSSNSNNTEYNTSSLETSNKGRIKTIIKNDKNTIKNNGNTKNMNKYLRLAGLLKTLLLKYSTPNKLKTMNYFNISIINNIKIKEIMNEINKIQKLSSHLYTACILTDEQIEWLSQLPYYIQCIDLNAIFVHAGINSNIINLTQQEPWVLMTMRSKLPSGKITARALSDHPWANTYTGPKTIYFGHDTARGLQVFSHAYGIDTGIGVVYFVL